MSIHTIHGRMCLSVNDIMYSIYGLSTIILQNKQTDAFKEVGPMFNEFQKANVRKI